MEIIHKFLNLVAPPFTFFSLLFLLPPYHIFKYFLSFLGIFFTEDLAGKVVIITGASSGIGESLAYEYAKKGAFLVLAARREKSLQTVAENARYLGSPDVIVVRGDVSKVEDCRRIIDQTMNTFGRLDHLVNNAGLSSVSVVEEIEDITNLRTVMDVNFWGSVYMTRFATPYLRYSRGRIVVISSVASWLPLPRMSFYNASKAAISQFFETLRVEFGPDIGITLVTPGMVASEVTQGKFLDKEGRLVVDPDTRDVQVNLIPIQTTENCAKGIIKGVIRGQRYVTEPSWYTATYFWKIFCPEVIELVYKLFYVTGSGGNESFGKKVLDYTGIKKFIYPESARALEIKRD